MTKKATQTTEKSKKPAPAKPKPEGYAGPGRPTLYRPEYCEKVIEWGRLGKSKAWMTATLEISRLTFADWERAHPAFLAATMRAVELSQKWWEDAGQNGMVANQFNSNVWVKNMNNRFRGDWGERQEITGKDGAPLTAGGADLAAAIFEVLRSAGGAEADES